MRVTSHAIFSYYGDQVVGCLDDYYALNRQKNKVQQPHIYSQFSE
jgi:hypothetical protein